MSYDIMFGVETVCANKDGDNHVIVACPEYDSPTYNLRDMFVACMGWDYEQGKWYPMTDVLPKIERGIRELTENREEYEKYNPPNGWGDLDGALECLKNWRDELINYRLSHFEPLTEIWPLEALWFRW